MITDELMTVGQLAKQMNVTVRTLQYYDKENLLKPSKTSSGNRRLYTKKDMVKLHQILSFKSLGFSLEDIKYFLAKLNTRDDFIASLDKQKETINFKMEQLKKAYETIETLEKEVKAIESIDLEKYADIIMFLQQNNPNYWVWKLLDDSVIRHIKERFAVEPEFGENLLETYEEIVNQAVLLQERNVDPASEESQKLAALWWELIMTFTGGDMSLIPKLMEFNYTLKEENNELGKKQKQVDAFLEAIVSVYIMSQQIPFFEQEE